MVKRNMGSEDKLINTVESGRRIARMRTGHGLGAGSSGGVKEHHSQSISSQYFKEKMQRQRGATAAGRARMSRATSCRILPRV